MKPSKWIEKRATEIRDGYYLREDTPIEDRGELDRKICQIQAILEYLDNNHKEKDEKWKSIVEECNKPFIDDDGETWYPAPNINADKVKKVLKEKDDKEK